MEDDQDRHARKGLPLSTLRTTDPEVAAAGLAAGNIAALPTETVYGLGALAASPTAIKRLYEVKGRPADHPVIVHVSGTDALDAWARAVPNSALKLADTFWPGPLTLVLPRSELAHDQITGGQPTVAVRAPAHPLFRDVLARLESELGHDIGVAAPSANRFGRVSPTTASHVEAELGKRLRVGKDVILDGGQCAVGLESTIVIWAGPVWHIAREGGITREQLSEVVDLASWGPVPERVPGALASHYSPKARLIVAESVAEADVGLRRRIGLLALSSVETPKGWDRLAAPATAGEYARVLYQALRLADERGVKLLVAVPPEPAGIGAAIRDRLARAST